MNELIVSYIILAGECHLPVLGSFQIKRTRSHHDVANKRMTPFTFSYLYAENSEKVSEGLLNYIGMKRNWTTDAAKEELKAWGHRVTGELANQHHFYLPSLGTIKQDAEGRLVFEAEKGEPLFGPVVANRVTHSDANHSVLVGDRESNSTEMNAYLHESKEARSSRWWIAALVMFGIGLLVFLMYIFSSTDDGGTLSNHSGISPQQIPNTYISK